MGRQHAVGETLRTGLLEGGLKPRILGRAESLSGPSWLVFLIEDGRVSLSNEHSPILGPALTWRPWNSETRAKFAPGVKGAYILFGTSALASAIGHMPEARDLRGFVNFDVTVDLSADRALLETLKPAFRGLHHELGAEAPGARASIDAYLRIILINVYRARVSETHLLDTTPSSHRAFTRFGSLVEMHFRERWTVNTYADRLGMSRDRLGDICRRVRGLGPKDLIDRRVALEARLQLESSSLSIQQIADLLGFSSSPQFTRFFQRMNGVSPGQYRMQFQGLKEIGRITPAVHYEWP